MLHLFSIPAPAWHHVLGICCLILLCIPSSLCTVIYEVTQAYDHVNSSLCCLLDPQAPYIDCCSLRMAWSLCLNQTADPYCEINLMVPEVLIDQSVGKALDFAIEMDGGAMANNNQVVMSLNGPAVIRMARVGQSGVHSRILGFPFNYTAYDTQSAQRNYSVTTFEACQGDLINLLTCYTIPVIYASDDTYLRLYGPTSDDGINMVELAADDDFCGGKSFIMHQFITAGCQTYELHAGCYGDKTCHGTVDGYMSNRIAGFPATTPNMTDTNDSLQKYTTVQFSVCAGQVIQLSSCFSSYSGDPYFRLTDSEGQEVYSNDNYCGNGAQITYTDSDTFITDNVNECFVKTYSLHIGCASDSTCAVNATGINWNPVPPTRFIEYDGSLGSSTNTGERASLSLNDLTIAFFGDLSLDGGTIWISGAMNLNVTNVDFHSNFGDSGAALYLDNIDPTSGVSPVQITSCKFISNQANFGAVYLNTNVDWLNIDSCVFDQNEKTGLYVSSNNDHLTVTNSTFSNNINDDVGGGICIMNNNEYATISRSSFIGNTARWAGGLYFDKFNNYGSIIDNYFRDNIGSSEGGAMYVYQYNEYMHIQSCRFESNVGYRGGVMRIHSYNVYFKIESCVFSNNRATSNSGAIDLIYFNDHMEILHSIFIKNRAGNNGGAIRFSQANDYVLFDNVTFTENEAPQGGAVYFYTSHKYNTFKNSFFFRNIAGGSGGGINIWQYNQNLLVKNCVFEGNEAGYGGGAIRQTEISNDRTVIDGSVFTDNLCKEVSGGALSLQKGENAEIKNCVFIGNSALNGNSGGAVGIGSGSTNFLIKNSTFTKNYAYQGGAFFSDSSRYVYIVGSTFNENFATNSAGAIYIKDDHTNFGLIDSKAYDTRVTVESSHPYSSDYPSGGTPYSIVQEYVVIDDASHLLIQFDQSTNIYFNDVSNAYLEWYCTDQFSIWDSPTKNIRYIKKDEPYPGQSAPLMVVEGNSIYVDFTGSDSSSYAPTTTGQDKFGIRIWVYGVFDETLTIKNVFSGNYAPEGGATTLYSSNQFPVIMNTVFSGNRATVSEGGAFQLGSSNNGATFVSTSFSNNSALSDGGAIRLRSTHSAVSFHMSNFDDNRVASRGGVFSLEVDNGQGLLSINQIFIRNCTANRNSASEGGVLYASSSNAVEIYDSTMETNYGSMGGSIYLSRGNSMLIQSTETNYNNANTNGGAIYAQDSNNLVISGSSFKNNSANYGGGALYCGYATVLQFADPDGVGNTSFNYNDAGTGGAILYRQSNVWNVDQNNYVEFNGNKAHVGSALTMISVLFPSSTPKMERLKLVNNHASLGCTIYWIKNSVMSVFPQISSSVIWDGNMAKYGEMIGSQPISLHGPQLYNVTVYGEPLNPAPEYFAYDAYDQWIPFDNDGTWAVATVSNYSGCGGLYGYLAGVTSFVFKEGGLKLNDMSATCVPGGNMEIRLEFQSAFSLLLADTSVSTPSVEIVTMFKFRDCIDGEMLVRPICQVCGDFTYSLSYDPDAKCEVCAGIEGIANCSSNSLNLKEGNWRRTVDTDAVFECPMEGACLGGSGVADESCNVAYEGPICAVCTEGYFMTEGACLPCDETSNIFTPQLIIFICVFSLAIIIVACAYLYTRVTAKSVTKLNEELHHLSADEIQRAQRAIQKREEAKILEEAPPSQLEVWYLWFKLRSSAAMVKVKIIIATVQVVSETPSIFSIKFPSSFEKFSNSFGFLNISLSGIFPLACGNSWSFIDNMMLTTLAPIGVCVLMFIAFEIDLYMRLREVRREQEDKNIEHTEQLLIESEQYEEAKDTYFNYFFFLTYLVLPNVTVTIFETFVCVNVDPGGNDNYEYDYFLKADYSVNCEDNYYKSGVIYAVIMLFVYPIGIPGLYYYFLYHAKEEIKSRDDVVEETVASSGNDKKSENEDIAVLNAMHTESKRNEDQTVKCIESHSELSPSTLRLAFLYDAYEPKFWYFELIETNRRLMMTAVLSVLGPGTSEQAVAAVVLSVFYIKLYNYAAPYCESSDDVLAETGQFQIFFTFFFGMVLSNQLVSSDLDNVLGVFLVIMNLGVVYLTVGYEVKAALGEAQALKEEEQELLDRQKLLPKPIGVSEGLSTGSTASRRRSSVLVQQSVQENSDRHHNKLIPSHGAQSAAVKAAYQYERAINRRRSSTGTDLRRFQSRCSKDSDDEESSEDEDASKHTMETKSRVASSTEVELTSVIESSGGGHENENNRTSPTSTSDDSMNTNHDVIPNSELNNDAIPCYTELEEHKIDASSIV